MLKTPAAKAVVNTAYFPNIMDLAFYSHEQDNNVINNNAARLLVPGAGLINGLSSDNGTRMVTAVSAGLGGAMSGHLKNPHIALATAGGVDLAANGIQGLYKMIDQQENLTDA